MSATDVTPFAGDNSASPLMFLLRGSKSKPTPDALAGLEAEWHDVWRLLPDPILLLDDTGRILQLNRAGMDFLQRWQSPERLPACLLALVQDVFASGRDYIPDQAEARLAFQLDAEKRYYLPRIVLDREGSVTCKRAVLQLLDVTPWQLSAEHGHSLATVASHEIKTPLTSVRTALYLLLEETFGSLTQRQRGLAADARDNLERALLLINQLLDLEVSENGGAALKPQRVEIIDLVEGVKAEVGQLLRVKNLQLVVELGPDLPALHVDRQRIFLVLKNLLANAIKYSPVGSEVALRVAWHTKNRIAFSVADRGPGISATHRLRIFDRFYRVPGQAKSGTGLGLAVARQNVLAHKGEIGCRSEPGAGSEFYFYLPAPDKPAHAAH